MIKQFNTPDDLARGAAAHFVEATKQTIDERGQFHVALSGGSTPKRLHHILAAEFKSAVDWSKVWIYWGDERTVPPDHPDSNYRMAKETLLDFVPIPAGNIHRIMAELDPHEAADQYNAVVKPIDFDLIFLGMGDDGHTASLFPHTEALKVMDRDVVANHVPKLDTWRITLTIPKINAAKQVMFLVAGDSKAETLAHVLKGEHQPEDYPSQFIKPALWLVDAAAYAQMG